MNEALLPDEISPKHLRLRGTIIPSFGPPCFGIPVFGDARGRYVQDLDIAGVVRRFLPITLSPHEKLVPVRGHTRLSVGAEPLYAFVVNDSQIFHHKREEMQTLLRSMLDLFDDRPFLLVDIHEFNENPEGLANAFEEAALLLAKQDGDTAAKWLQMEAPSVFEKWLEEADAGDDSKKNSSEDGARGGMMA